MGAKPGLSRVKLSRSAARQKAGKCDGGGKLFVYNCPCTAVPVRYIPYMKFSEEELKEFIEIWKKEFGEELTLGQADIRGE